MAYTYAQLEGLWINAGGNPVFAPIAAAVAMAESGGNPDAFNASDPAGGSRGLWQINGVHGAQSTFDPMGNARAAVQISNNGSNWQPWSTFTNGSYRKFLQPGIAPDQTVAGNGTAAQQTSLQGGNGAVGTPAEPIKCSWFMWAIGPAQCAAGSVAGGSTTAILGSLFEGLIKIVVNPVLILISGTLGILGGAVLMIAGMATLVAQTKVGREAATTALTAAATA